MSVYNDEMDWYSVPPANCLLTHSPLNINAQVYNEGDYIKKQVTKKTKKAIWLTYISDKIFFYPCFCCRINIIRFDFFTAGHVTSEKRCWELGRRYDPEDVSNFRPICHECNLKMGTKNMFDYINKNFIYNDAQKSYYS